MTQKEKTKFRASSKWKKFRAYMKKVCGNKDLITNKSLYKGWNLHHKNLNEDQYENITNDNDFIPLNQQTHETIHWLYRYYRTDKEILERIKNLLDDMLRYENDR